MRKNAVNNRLAIMWTQIANRFKNYAARLLFAGTHEVMVTDDYSTPTAQYYTGKTWMKYSVQMDVSGYNHNVAYRLMSLRPTLYAAGKGKVRFSNLVYRALP